jgi:nitrogen fixation NifU-like protein
VFSPQLLDHFQNPRNPGEVSHPDASIRVDNPVCGDILSITLRVTGEQITEIRFLAKGCVPAMGCASALTELVKGTTLQAARGLSRTDLQQAVGSLPQASTHAADLAIQALRAALDAVKIRPIHQAAESP